MDVSGRTSQVYRFGPYEVDTGARQLRKRGSRIRLRQQSYEILVALLERPGDVVTRAELRQRLWPVACFLEFDNSINSAVHRLREALTDSSEQAKFIQTLPRVGYRFVAHLDSTTQGSKGHGKRQVRLAVLPLDNLSGDPAEEYFSDGMTEELITQLACAAPERLRVIARTSAMHYKGTREDTAHIGRELGVDYLVEGSIRRATDRIRISAQLIQVCDQTHLWADSYDGELRDILNLQREVALAITSQIRVSLPMADKRGPIQREISPEGYDDYIRGLYHLGKYNPVALNKATECFERAVGKDPTYAPAHAKLALVRALLAFWGWAPRGPLMGMAEESAARALHLDSNNADAHNALADVLWFYHWNLPAAEQELERAVTLAPNDPLCHWGLSSFLGAVKEDHERAIAEAELALKADPLSVLIRAEAGWPFYWGRQFDRAIAQSRRALDLDPNCVTACWIIGMALLAKSSFEEAIATFCDVTTRFGDDFSLGALGLACALAGQQDRARSVLAELGRRSVGRWVSEVYFAWVHIGLGEKGIALNWLERAFQERNPHILFLRVAATYDSLRSEPRYQQLVGQLNLPNRSPARR